MSMIYQIYLFRKITFIIIFLIPFFYISCKSQYNSRQEVDNYKNKNEESLKRFNFKEYRNTNYGKILPLYTKNGIIQNIGFENITGGYIKEDLPSPSFYTIYTLYYANGNLKACHTLLGNKVKIDTSYYYNRRGELMSKVYENEIFDKIQPIDILKFLDKKGYINLKTGEGRYNEAGNPIFEVSFEVKRNSETTKKGIQKIEENKDKYEDGQKIWKIQVLRDKKLVLDKFKFHIYYEIDADTGEIFYTNDKNTQRGESIL